MLQDAGGGSYFEWATLALSAAGLAFIWFQLRQAADSSKASLLLSINRDLNSYGQVATRIEEGRSEGWLSKLSAAELEQLLDYISYFEGLYLAYQRRLFSLREINDYFAGRFFRLAHNPDVQTQLLLNEAVYADTFRPIFALHKRLTEYRSRRNRSPLYPNTPLDRLNPALYNHLAK